MAFERRRQSGDLRALAAAGIAVAAAALLAGCAPVPHQSHPSRAASGPASSVPSSALPAYAAEVRVVSGPGRMECVPYARQLSGIALRGDAWSWWDAARGAYERGRTPAPGAVLVLKRQGGSRGHLAVVTRVVDDRVVLAHHANWLNRGRVYENTPIRDVSRDGDWSAVRVWYPPGNTWGKSTYGAYGFIYGRGQVARTE